MGSEIFQGRVAIVTGSTSGIGLGIARSLAAGGADILLNGLVTTESAERLRKDLSTEYGVRVEFSGANMMRPDEIAAMVVQAERHFGHVDILVNNAGIQYTSPVEAFPPDRWDAILAVNLSAAFHGIRAVLPGMKSRNWGRIVNIASTHGLVASVNKAAYVAAKHGLIGLTRVVALETARTGITCNAICPGWALTPLVQKQIDDMADRDGISSDSAREKLLSEKQPSCQFVTPDQIGSLVVFLCSDAAAQVKGAAWTVDGGWTAQ